MKTSTSVRSKVWFVVGDMHTFGSGLARLLENIDHHGTLSQAARETGMSYRHAWNLIKTAEKNLGGRLTIPYPGGVGGGRSELSLEGRRMLDAFQRLRDEVAAYADERFSELFIGEDR